MDSDEVAAMAEAVKQKKAAMERAKRLYMAGHGTFAELETAAKAFCAAFGEYHLAKYGKPKRLDWRAVIR
jgi:hypothetical protein